MTTNVGLVFRAFALLAAMATGCSQRPAAASAETNAPPARSAAVDVLTQRGTVEAGLRARDRIHAIEAAERTKVNAVLDAGETEKP
jgi:alpha-D-ribose 1-methylphosphonate 5-triphosphate diphosphatase PhnM